MRYPKTLTYEKVYNHVLELFAYDRDKANSWWMTPNDLFDNKSPYQMVKEGNGRQLVKYIQRCG